MLREIVIARKADGEWERRWYEDERMDLFVWFGSSGDIERFQLTYDKSIAGKAIDWKRGQGAVHMLIDDRGSGFGHPVTPLLSMGGMFAKDRVIDYFREHAAQIDPKMSTFVLQTLQQFREPVRGPKSKLLFIGALACGMLIAWRLLR